MIHFTPSAFRDTVSVKEKEVLLSLYLESTQENLMVLLWARDGKRLHLVIKKKKEPKGPFGSMMYADIFIQASGIHTSRFHQPIEPTPKAILTRSALALFDADY
jgi:hypothetical protein